MEKDTWENLKTLRDELEVQSHLFGMETKDLWNDLEKKFTELSQRFKNTLEVMEEVNENVKEGYKLTLDEVKLGYEKIKKTL